MKKTISIITLGGILMLFVYACSADFLDTKPAMSYLRPEFGIMQSWLFKL